MSNVQWHESRRLTPTRCTNHGFFAAHRLRTYETVQCFPVTLSRVETKMSPVMPINSVLASQDSTGVVSGAVLLTDETFLGSDQGSVVEDRVETQMSCDPREPARYAATATLCGSGRTSARNEPTIENVNCLSECILRIAVHKVNGIKS